MNKFIWIAYALIWIFVSVAICYAIHVTNEWKCLWFLLIPSLLSIHLENDDNNSHN